MLSCSTHNASHDLTVTLIPGVEGENPHIELKEFEIVCRAFQDLNSNVFFILNQFKVLVVSLTTN